ncbi:MAG: adenylyltransferase/cytidyltransferase family protein, partial [Candidatus Marinimicrobia bacterium]|nr:adenylyltransferase/cytidyltransferase family protein [Candidatus Neomarinimicrobiota bacterium]
MAILDSSVAQQQVRNWQQAGKTIVFTNGCFDLLHAGHIDLFNQARALGDFLIIGLNSDHSIRRLKGINRP